MMSRLDHDPAQAREALRSARFVRAENLVHLSAGAHTLLQFILTATTHDGKPLRSVTLRQLLGSQKGFGPTRTESFLSAVAARLGTREDVGEKTISWLLDFRCGGRRFYAWLDVQQKMVLPWPGYPLVGKPSGDNAMIERVAS